MQVSETKHRVHSCDEMYYKGSIRIATLELTHTKWALFLDDFGITVYDIKYCPYCGVKLA